MKILTLFWRNTTSVIDANELYDHIVKAIETKTELTIEFRDNISWVFAKEFWDLLKNSDIDYDKIKQHVKLKGFSSLSQFSWNNMASAKVNAECTQDYLRNGYGTWMDGW